jgi:hypothetical protein
VSKGNTTETDVLAKLFNNTAISWDANTNLYVALHTADPGEAGTQPTSEATYTGYARVTVARTSGGFTVSGGSVTNAAAITFGACTAGTNTITHFSVGTATSGAGQILYSGALTASLAVSSGITPQFAIGALTVTED